MRFTVVTLFPEMFESFLAASLLGKALENGTVRVDFVNPRNFTSDVHRTVDDAPYGGGAGMVMKAPALIAAIESVDPRASGAEGVPPHRVMMAPSGRPLDQQGVRRLAATGHIVLVCGRYEGPDERIIDLAIDEVVSVGDYVLSGGEAAAMITIDAVSRLVPGVLGKMESTEDESFEDGLLEYPHYTRPIEVRGVGVPDVLRSGNHKAIAEWRHQQSLLRTRARRPDLYRAHGDRARVRSAARTYLALVHHPVLDRTGELVTSSVTNLDVHDIARSATTYGLAGYLAISPVESQRDKITGIAQTWQRLAAKEIGDHRHQALGLLRALPSIEAAIELVARRHKKQHPLTVATSARHCDGAVQAEQLVGDFADDDRPVLLLFGTGWGLADSVIEGAEQILAPISGINDFNHLSVRSAVAIMLDRLFGASGAGSA